MYRDGLWEHYLKLIPARVLSNFEQILLDFIRQY
jgi:hypothetical protein